MSSRAHILQGILFILSQNSHQPNVHFCHLYLSLVRPWELFFLSKLVIKCKFVFFATVKTISFELSFPPKIWERKKIIMNSNLENRVDVEEYCCYLNHEVLVAYAMLCEGRLLKKVKMLSACYSLVSDHNFSILYKDLHFCVY